MIVIEKLEKDKQTLKDAFSNLKSSIVEDSLNPINNFTDFLTANYAFLSACVQNMKEVYGDSIKWKTVVNTLIMPLNIRNYWSSWERMISPKKIVQKSTKHANQFSKWQLKTLKKTISSMCSRWLIRLLLWSSVKLCLMRVSWTLMMENQKKSLLLLLIATLQ